jgi:hypothetical protein
VHDIFVAHVVLKGSGIMPVVGQLITGRVAKHVRVDREWKFCSLSSPCDHFQETGGRSPAAADLISVRANLPNSIVRCSIVRREPESAKKKSATSVDIASSRRAAQAARAGRSDRAAAALARTRNQREREWLTRTHSNKHGVRYAVSAFANVT